MSFVPHMRRAGDDGDDGAAGARRFCVRDGEVLVAANADGPATFPSDVPQGPEQVLGSHDGRTVLAIDGTDRAAPPGTRWCDLRTLYRLVDASDWGLAARAVQVVHWDRTHRYCGRCGTPTVPATGERMRRCPRCGLHAYPRVSPAIIVLVTRGEHDEQALLAWGTRRPQPFYSTLAGFVEIGETLEEALEREIAEEVGIAVRDVTYFGSQAWPFPHQLMVGYRARHAGGELVLQESEIREARWFTADEVARERSAVRGSFSIAGQLIDGWLSEQASRNGDQPSVARR